MRLYNCSCDDNPDVADTSCGKKHMIRHAWWLQGAQGQIVPAGELAVFQIMIYDSNTSSYISLLSSSAIWAPKIHK
jgi:hypothetical protein